jgi:hypothetical protein
MCSLSRKRKSKKRQWFPVDEDVEERQVPQQESMKLQLLQHEPMQMVDDAMDLQVQQHEPMQVVDQPMEEVHIVEVVSTPKKVLSIRN